MSCSLLLAFVVFAQTPVNPVGPALETVRRYKAPEARQAVAVDKDHFYAITNRWIAKYEKRSGKRLVEWRGAEDGPIQHLNSGIVLGNRLYCANSNFPEVPMVGSIEIFETKSLRHVGSHSFGIDAGSATWIDRRQGSWWVVFAHYNGRGGEPGMSNDRTQLVQYDGEFRRVAGYVFPKSVVDRWDGMSSSGGVWRNETLITSGHHAPEIYVMRLPQQGSRLELVSIHAMECEGQGIALDPVDPTLLWGIQRRTGEVLLMKMP
jgi:hypothetical protein